MTPTQRRILWLMRELGEQFVTETGAGARLNGFGHGQAEEGGLVIRAYQTPLYFMCGTATASGRTEAWLRPVDRNARGRWYELTDAGRAAAETIREEPPAPPRNSRSSFGRRYK